MEIERYRLQKKWWHGAGNYTVTNEAGHVVFKSERMRFFKVGIRLMNQDKSQEVLSLKAANMWISKFNFLEGDNVVGTLEKSSVFSNAKITLRDKDGEIFISSKRWGKQMNFSRDNADVAHASSSNNMWNNIGVVVNEGTDARKIIAMVILVAYLKVNGYR